MRKALRRAQDQDLEETEMKRNLISIAVVLLALILSDVWSPAQAQRRGRFGSTTACLTGTYRLNPTRSDDATRIAETATLNLSGNRDQVRDNLVRRLDAPD